MKTRTTILRSSPGKYETAEVELEEPRAGEVLVKLVSAGLCHTDDHLAAGDLPVPVYPIAVGHEGAGIVHQVGPGVTQFREGDHVVFSFIPACGRCRFCARGQQNLCDLGATMLVGSRFQDPTSFRMSMDGAPVAQMAGISTLSEYTTVDVNSCVKVPEDLSLRALCLLGCGVSTGWGSVVNSANTQIGDTVVVMGVGGIGINAIQGAVHAGALHVFAVDPVAFKREKAERFGATQAFENMDEAIDAAKSVTNGQGADAAIVTVGVTSGEHLAQGFASIRKGGTLVATGVGNMMEVGLPIPLGELVLFQKRIHGSLFGECSPSVDIPRQIEMYRAGTLKLDELVTTTYTLDQVAQGYEDMHAGKNIRGVVVFE